MKICVKDCTTEVTEMCQSIQIPKLKRRVSCQPELPVSSRIFSTPEVSSRTDQAALSEAIEFQDAFLPSASSSSFH